MNKKYFRLKPECFLTPGLKCSVIQNLVTGEALWFDEANTEELAKSEYNQLVDPEKQLFQELHKKGWGFFSDNKVFVDKIRPINVFREKKLWKETPYITLGILQLTNVCNLNCTFCRKAFCPICTVVEEHPTETSPLELHSWLNVINELNYFGAKSLILTGGNPLLFTGIGEVIEHALKLGMQVQLHTNGYIAPGNIKRSVIVSILVSKQEELSLVIKNFHDFENVILFLMNFDLPGMDVQIRPNWKVITTSDKAPVITKNTLAKMDFDQFFARKLNNNCLNAKMYITHNGNVIPCFGNKTGVIGNIKTGNFSKVLKQLVNEYWNVPVDQIPDRKCVICEFKYACLSCRFLDVNQNCKYDIDKAQWA